MAQVGVMVHIPDEDLRYLSSSDIGNALRAAGRQVQEGSLSGDFVHKDSGLHFQIRSIGVEVSKRV